MGLLHQLYWFKQRCSVCLQNLDELTEKAVPSSIRLDKELDFEEPLGLHHVNLE
jgi:hypothetical protein